MIRTVSDLLEGLIKRGQKILDLEVSIKHGPTIGSMYEGLTREVLEKSIFDKLDLKIVSGFIINSDNTHSGEIDCMVVVGNGKRVPHTEKYLYNISNVIAVIEVKKTLYGNSLDEAFLHFRSILPQPEPEEWMVPLVSDAWKSIVGTALPTAKEATALPVYQQMVRSNLAREARMPIRIIFGYHGYTSELGLRNGFRKCLRSSISNKTTDEAALPFGMLSLPNLIICRNFHLIKLNGMPFATRGDRTEEWPIYASRARNPIRSLLEIIWTRISYRFSLGAFIFGEDLDREAINPLLRAKWSSGWQFYPHNLSENELNHGIDSEAWEPEFLSLAEFTAVNLILNHGTVTQRELDEFLNEQNVSFTDLSLSLNAKRLVWEKNGVLRMLTAGCIAGITKDGRFFAGENMTGRVSRWLSNFANQG